VSVARFIADQRTNYRVPHTITCLLLGVSLAWFYKWRDRPATPRQRRRAELDAAVKAMFDDAKGVHGSPRLHADLRDAGWTVSEKTVADSMRRQGLVARQVKQRRGLTKQDRSAAKFPDLVRRDFSAAGPNLKWCGDITEIPTADGKLYLATVIDLYSRRLLAAATSRRCDAFVSPWAGSGPTSTTWCSTPRSSPAWNGKSCPATSCATLIMLGPSCCPGVMSSITTAGGIAAPVC